ncbi:hypothetical protein V6N11_061188 [Hibiscus sabdariffa]|uniref:Uncharacterized protein n=1 Tax=Hibiscus sabdariffa TaxID=183260 RepID=A0ABR1ZZW5_9ROSI
MKPGSLPLHLGFHLTTDGYPIGDYTLVAPIWCASVPCSSVCSNAIVVCLNLESLLCVRQAPSPDPWVHIHCYATFSTLGAHVQWPACTPSRLAGCSARGPSVACLFAP